MSRPPTHRFETDPVRPPYELGTADARRGLGTWIVVAAMVVACVASFSLAAVMLAPPSPENHLWELPVADGPWLIEWGRSMQLPSVEQADQVRALRLVVGGAAALVSVLCLLIVVGLWRQRLRLRRAEYFVHWAVGARRLQMAARLTGEGRLWAAAALALSLLGTAVVLGLIRRSFPGDASVSPDFAAGAVLLTGIAVVLIRWEGNAGRLAAEVNQSRTWEFLASPPIVGAVGFAVLSGVGILAFHAPYASASAAGDEGTVIGASLSSLPIESRGDEIVAWGERIEAARAQVGFASAGAARAVGHRDVATVECGRCSEGTLPMPIKFVTAEVHAVAPDTFAHLGITVSRGRDFDNELDRGTPNVAIVSQALAGRHFERGQPLGKRVRIGDSDWLTVVGVVGGRDDVRSYGNYAIYVALAQVQPTAIEILAKGEARSILGAAPRGVSLSPQRSLRDVFSVHLWFRALLNALGLAALALVAAGLWVSARNEADATRYEVLVRRAVGAKRGHVWRFYLSFAGRRLFATLLAGAWLSLFVGAGLAETYGSIPQIDFAVWAAVAAWVSAMYLVGSAPPFLRAASSPLLPTINIEA